MFIMGGQPPAINARITLQGQSNCWGVGVISDLAALGDGLAAMAASVFDRVYIDNGSSYQKLQMGVNNRAYDANGRGPAFGPEFGLAVRWMRETTRGLLFIDKAFIDGSPIAPFQDGGGFFNTLKASRTSLNAWLVTNGITGVRDVAWMWVQGEGDNAATEAYYLDQLNTYTTSLATSSPVICPANCKKIITQIPATTAAFGQGVADAKVAFVAANPTARLVPYRNSMNADNLHLDARGQVQIGYDGIERSLNKPHLTA